MTATIARRWTTIGLVLCLGSVAARSEDVPPRTEGGQTLAVPQEELNLGEVYYVMPGEDTQIVCRSDAPLQRLAISCNRVVGYFVTPFELIEGQPPLLAGALRIPAAALQTGMKPIDEVLRTAPALNAAEYPELTFRLTRVSDVKPLGTENRRTRYTLTLVGELVVKDKTIELELPAEMALIPFTWQTMGRTVGELLTLRTRADLKLADLGLQKLDRSYNERIADTLNVDVFLLCNTVSPEKNLDPQIKTAHLLKQLRMLTWLRDFADADKGYEFGRAFVQEIWGDAQALGRLAMTVLSEDGIAARDFRFILKAARRANELTESKDAALLALLGRVHHEMGQLDDAVQRLRQAVEHLEGAPPPVATQIRATLEQYEHEVEREHE